MSTKNWLLIPCLFIGILIAVFYVRHNQTESFITRFASNQNAGPAAFENDDEDIHSSGFAHDWKTALLEIAGDFSGNRFYYNCSNMIRRGNWYDCNTTPFIIRKPCLIYSFGINYDFTFDDAMAGLGCEVFSFDPSMGNTKEHIRPTGVHFYPIGIGASSDDHFSPRMDVYTKNHPGQKWKIRTLKQIMETFKHQERYLDILKIDIEGYEWKVIENIIQDNLLRKIRQLNIEFHIFSDIGLDKVLQFHRIYQSFKQTGFKRYIVTHHYFDLVDKNKRRIQTETGFVNMKFGY